MNRESFPLCLNCLIQGVFPCTWTAWYREFSPALELLDTGSFPLCLNCLIQVVFPCIFLSPALKLLDTGSFPLHLNCLIQGVFPCVWTAWYREFSLVMELLDRIFRCIWTAWHRAFPCTLHSPWGTARWRTWMFFLDFLSRWAISLSFPFCRWNQTSTTFTTNGSAPHTDNKTS